MTEQESKDEKVEEAFRVVEDEINQRSESYWVRHLKRNNAYEMELIANNYPKEKTLNIDVSRILNQDIWNQTLSNPRGISMDIIEALKQAVPYPKTKWEHHGFSKVVVRYFNVAQKKTIRDLRQEDERKLIGIKALVRSVSPVRPITVRACFKDDANHRITVEAVNGKIQIPHRCNVDGCTHTFFENIEKQDVKKNNQTMVIQDVIDGDNCWQPSTIKCELLEDLCNKVMAGDRVIVNGQYRSRSIWKGKVLTVHKEIYFDVSSFEFNERAFDDMDITDEDKKTIEILSKEKGIFDKIANSIAPSIYGLHLQKKAIALLLFEGVTKNTDEGMTSRGHINILLVSDPGMAKTQLLRHVAAISPKKQFATASTSSKVGLIAPLIKDETGVFILQAGAYAMANGGVLCLDEVSELSDEDFKYIGEAMESGKAKITKGGIDSEIITRASLLAACNPKEGCFNGYKPLMEQVNIPDATVSRFDLIILMQDDIQDDGEMAKYTCDVYRNGVDMTDRIDSNLLRKYIAYSRSIMPSPNSDAERELNDAFELMRKSPNNGERTKIYKRHLWSLRRLSEAHARMRLSPEITKEDSGAAITLFNDCLKAGPVINNPRKPQETLMGAIEKAIKEFGSNNTATEEAIVTAVVKKGYYDDKVREMIREMHRIGRLIEPRTDSGIYKLQPR